MFNIYKNTDHIIYEMCKIDKLNNAQFVSAN